MTERDPEREKYFRNAFSNYMGVLSTADKLFGEIPFDPSEPVPDNWEDDPLILLGKYLEPLNLTAREKRKQRDDLRDIVASHDAEWVWKNRFRLAAEIEFIRNF